MKKELLIATALVGSVGLAGVAEAASMSLSGSQKIGIAGTDSDGTATAAKASLIQSNLSGSISETTDSGIKLSTGFTILNESTGAASNNASGLTLTFTDGSSLDLISGGNASGSHDVAPPAGGLEGALAYSSVNNAPGGIDFVGSSDGVGFEYHSVADAMGITGLKWGLSASFNDEAAASSAGAIDTGYGVGVTYVTSAGDTSVTVGAGYAAAEYVGTSLTKDENGGHAGVSAVTGNLTVAAAYGTGDTVGTTTTPTQNDMTATEMGAKYVSGDITFSVGYLSSSGTDNSYGASVATKDEKKQTSASVDYVIASGVTGTIGYRDQEGKNEGTVTTNDSGTSWYIGATISF
jgi:predicted porin